MEIWIHTKEMKAARNGKYTGKKKKIFFSLILKYFKR